MTVILVSHYDWIMINIKKYAIQSQTLVSVGFYRNGLDILTKNLKNIQSISNQSSVFNCHTPARLFPFVYLI